MNRITGDLIPYFIQRDMPRGTDGRAGPAGNAHIRLKMKRRIYRHVNAPSRKADGVNAHALANSRAKAAKNARIVFLAETRLFDIVFFSQIFEDFHLRASGIQQLDNEFTNLVNPLGIGFDLHPFPNGVVACGNISNPAAVMQFHGAQTAHAGGFQCFMMTQGRDIHAVFLGNLKDSLEMEPFCLNCMNTGISIRKGSK